MGLICGPAGGQIVYPPQHRDWFECLPAPFNADIEVVCVMRPESWDMGTVGTKDERYTFFVLKSPQGTVQGLQVRDAKLDTYLDHQRVLRDYRVEMASPSYIGPMSRFPQTLCMELDRTPLLFSSEHMWKTFLDLRRMWQPNELKV